MKKPGGDDGDDGECPMQWTQSSAVMTAHGGVDGGSSQDVAMADDIRGVMDPRVKMESRWYRVTSLALET